MIRLPGDQQREIYVNAKNVAWVTVQRNGEAVRVVYARGKSLDAHDYAEPEDIQHFVQEFKNDPRFTPIKSGSEFINFDHALKVILDHDSLTATVYLAGLAPLEIGSEDFEAVQQRLSAAG